MACHAVQCDACRYARCSHLGPLEQPALVAAHARAFFGDVLHGRSAPQPGGRELVIDAAPAPEGGAQHAKPHALARARSKL